MNAGGVHASDLRGETVEQHAIVLSALILKESDKLVSLYTRDFGKISTIAKGAAKSLKRFGPGLESFTHVKAQIKSPKTSSEESKIWFLERVDIQSSFPHLRKTYESIESSFFVIKLVLDLIPDGVSDPILFKALGRFLRDSESFDLRKNSSWARSAFLVWFARHAGFGSIDNGMWDNLENCPSQVKEAWEKCLTPDDPNFKNLFEVLSLLLPTPPSIQDEVLIYKKWVESSGLHWEHFEKWLSSKRF